MNTKDQGDEITGNEINEAYGFKQEEVKETESPKQLNPAKETPEAPAKEVATEQPPAEKPPAFTPSFKFKAYEKEYEIPEQYRALIKDEASQNEVKKMFEKAYGFDGLMPKYKRVRENFESLQKQHNSYQESVKPQLELVSKATRFLNNNDLDSFFDAVGLDEKKLLQHIKFKLNLSEDQKALYDSQRAALRKAYELEDQNAQLAQEYEQSQSALGETAVSQREQELDTAINEPTIAQFASHYDTLAGEEGAFKAEVVQRAILHLNQTGEDLSAKDAVTKTYERLSKTVRMSTPTPEQTQVNAVEAAKKLIQNKKALPVIPATSTAPGSPVAKKVTSMDDLLAKRKRLLAQNE